MMPNYIANCLPEGSAVILRGGRRVIFFKNIVLEPNVVGEISEVTSLPAKRRHAVRS